MEALLRLTIEADLIVTIDGTEDPILVGVFPPNVDESDVRLALLDPVVLDYVVLTVFDENGDEVEDYG